MPKLSETEAAALKYLKSGYFKASRSVQREFHRAVIGELTWSGRYPVWAQSIAGVFGIVIGWSLHAL